MIPHTDLYPRHAARPLADALAYSPAALVHGPRQCGKTTLARSVGGPLGYSYVSFDDDVARLTAEADPAGFLSDLPERVVLDEVQRVPGLFAALKVAIDRRRTPGRFILTGSSNVLLVPRLSDSLAGRMHVLRLHPLSQAELGRPGPGPSASPGRAVQGGPAQPSVGFLDALFGGGPDFQVAERLGAELAERIVAGGYPAALVRPKGRWRTEWYRSYVETIVARDVRDLARIRHLDALPKLLSVAAAGTAQLFNATKLASTFGVGRATVHDYVTLLERVFLLNRIQPWHGSRLKRLVKTPKLHLGDTGLACTLLGTDAAYLAAERTLLGQLLETFVCQELRRMASGHPEPHSFHHYRDKDGAEVDIVIERGRAVAGVKVKAAATVNRADFRGLRKLRAALGSRFAGGVVLYDGELGVSFGEGLRAVPIRALWETTKACAGSVNSRSGTVTAHELSELAG